jgi:hypothetical protein
MFDLNADMRESTPSDSSFGHDLRLSGSVPSRIAEDCNELFLST